jgi:hypothetical protein
MDSNGSRELARLLEERNGAAPPPVRGKRLQSTTAAPIFHWFGIEPPTVLSSAAEEPQKALSRRPRLAG